MNKYVRLTKAVLTVRPFRKWIARKIISANVVSKIVKETGKSDRPVILYASEFDFTYPLTQRPHHMLRLLAKAGYPVICCADIKHVRKDEDNLYLIPRAALKSLIGAKKLDKILFFSNGTPIADYKIKDDSLSFYELIDDYELFGDEKHVKKRVAMFKKITNLPNTWTLVSANALYDRAIEYGASKEKVVFSKNAVNIEDFCKEPRYIPHAMKSVVAKGKPIVGYYGALTTMWFDFELVSDLARLHPEWEFVFIGLIYGDNAIKKETENRIADLQKYGNFTYIPPIGYEDIPLYAGNFSVATIPFQINEITKATNPVKLFEYMAMGLPIVTTPMPECKLYKSVFIANSVDEFSSAIANAIPLKTNREYQELLYREASENTWTARVDDILNIIKKHGSRPLLEVYKRNRDWITRNTIPEKGIVVVKSMTHGAYEGIAYPEVSGYYIPTLLNWGYRGLAVQYAKWLLSIQHNDGAWYDYCDTLPHVFDTGQVLKGLISIYPIMPNVKDAILSGCDWIIRQIDDKGRLQSPHGNAWSIPTCSDLIHLYCLQPILQAGKMLDRPEYLVAVDKVVSYYKTNDMDRLLDFHTLSHFYAYIVEALVDLGETDIARQAMEKVARLQRPDGSVPAYKDVNWVCSTGLFQFSVIWYKLGEKERADRAFDAAYKLQEKSGGWRGSYGWGADYSRDEEISWANKYFMDALALKVSSHFAATAREDAVLGDGAYKLVDEIADGDGRLRLALSTIQSKNAYSVLDVGCGFGRILKKIKEQNRNMYLCGVDISEAIISKLPLLSAGIEGKVGSLLQIPYWDNHFDFVTTTEALEHAIDIENAVKELVRVTKPGGHILIIDKNIKCWGMYKTPEWEQWFDKRKITKLLKKYGCSVSVTENIPYDDADGKSGLFIGWLAKKLEPNFIRRLNRRRKSLREKRRERKKSRILENAIEKAGNLVESSSVSKYYKIYRKHEKHYWEKAVVWLCDHVRGKENIAVLDIGCAYGTLAVFCKTWLGGGCPDGGLC